MWPDAQSDRFHGVIACILVSLVAAAFLITAAVTSARAQSAEPPAGRYVIRVDVSAHQYYNWWDVDSYATAEECEFARNHDPAFAADRDQFVAYETDQHGPSTVVTFYCWTPAPPDVKA